jgi:hypothetical protein
MVLHILGEKKLPQQSAIEQGGLGRKGGKGRQATADNMRSPCEEIDWRKKNELVTSK